MLCSASFSPTYGGPAGSVTGLAEALASLDCEVAIWSPDGSAHGNCFLAEGTGVKTLSGTFRNAISQIERPDVVHDSGIWMPHNHSIAVYCRKVAIPRVVSVRGMLEPWSRQHKRLKKILAWSLYQQSDLKIADALHVTSEREHETISKLGFMSPWHVPNGIRFPPRRIQDLKKSSAKTRTALFLGRLHPVKGLPMLIQSWAKSKPDGWQLEIVGPDEAGHRAELESDLEKYNLQGLVQICDPLYGDQKWLKYARADLFICPSYTENFGISIAEAMACGVPVITTRDTPWRVIEEQGIGWRVDANVSELSLAIDDATKRSTDTLSQMGELSRRYVTRRFNWVTVGDQMLARYSTLTE